MVICISQNEKQHNNNANRMGETKKKVEEL